MENEKSKRNEIQIMINEMDNLQNMIFSIKKDNFDEVLSFILKSKYTKEENIDSLFYIIYSAFIHLESKQDELEHLYSNINQYIQAFMNDQSQEKDIPNSLKYIYTLLNENFKSFINDKNNMQENCQNFLRGILKNDDIDQFQSFLSSKNVSVNQKFTNICQFKESISLIEASLYYNASQITKFLRINNIKLTKHILLFAVIGGNYDFLHYLVDSLKYDVGINELNKAIEFHQNEVAIWINEHLNIQYSKESLKIAIENYNFIMVHTIVKTVQFSFEDLLDLTSLSIEKGLYETFQYLFLQIDYKELSNYYCQNPHGKTILQIAASLGNLKIFKYLIKNEINIHILPLIQNETWILLNIEEKQKKITLDSPNLKKKTSLHYAAQNGLVSIVKEICEYNDIFDLNCRTTKQMTPFHFAAKTGQLNILKYMSQNDEIDVNAQSIIGWTALHFAVYSRNIDCIKFLCSLKDQINIEIKDRFGQTPYDLAVEINDKEIEDVFLNSVDFEYDDETANSYTDNDSKSDYTSETQDDYSN